MNTRDLFEDRAMRGTPRGAAAVWRNAHNDASVVDGPRRPTWGFRLALAAWVVALVVGALSVRQPDDAGVDPTTTSPTEPTEGDPTSASSSPLPAPLLVDGGTIVSDRGGVSLPSDPAYDELLASFGIETDVDVVFSTDVVLSDATLVFAQPEDPFSGPIVGLELLPNNGVRPWGANLDSTALTAFVDQLQRVDGSWTMPASSGLVKVAEVTLVSGDFMRYGWQFDFKSGDDRVTLQAEANTTSRPADEWLWISRLAYGVSTTGGSEMTVRPIEVLGRTGVVVDAGFRAANEVVWSDGDFAYRLTSSTIEGDTAVPRDATEDLGRLRLVEREEWVDAIRTSFDVSISERILGFGLLLTLPAAIAGAVWFLIRRSFGAAAIAAVVAVMLWWMGGPGAVEFALAWIGLAIAWWRHRSSTAANSAGPSAPSPGQGPGSLGVTG